MKKAALLIISIFLSHLTFAQWSAMGSGPGGVVRALCNSGGTLYAGGDFSGLVKKWNGSSWVAVGSLSGTKVNALISFNGSLYAGGAFTVTSGNFNVARWNGSAWVAVGEGLAGVGGSEVKTFCVYNNALYAGGTFTQSGTASLSKVGKLNSAGTAWAQAGGGAPPKCQAGVHAMAVYYNELYVGGEGSAPWINKLNIGGQLWDELGSSGSISGGNGIYALSAFKYPNQSTYSLFVGGKFSSPFTNCCTYYSGSWGTAFNTFSNQTADRVKCFLASSSGAVGSIYAGGVFTVNSAANLAKKPISGPWAAEGTNTFNNSVNAMCFFSGYIVAGGDFTSPGTNVARFATTIGVEEINDNIITNQVYPNPVIQASLLKVQTKNAILQPSMTLMDANGKNVAAHYRLSGFNHSQNEIEFRIDREGLASGIYFYQVLDEERTIATGKMVVE